MNLLFLLLLQFTYSLEIDKPEPGINYAYSIDSVIVFTGNIVTGNVDTTNALMLNDSTYINYYDNIDIGKYKAFGLFYFRFDFQDNESNALIIPSNIYEFKIDNITSVPYIPEPRPEPEPETHKRWYQRLIESIINFFKNLF